MRVLYIGQSHRINDPRLRYREMQLLYDSIDAIEFWFLEYETLPEGTPKNAEKTLTVHISKELVSGITVNRLIIRGSYPSPFGTRGQVLEIGYNDIIQAVTDSLSGYPIAVVQASDVREIKFAIQLGKVLGSILVYDSHEDYFRQAIDYGNKSRKKYIWAALFLYTEMRYIRQFDYVFCTDKYLEQKYSRWIYSAKSVNLLRNFPLVTPSLGLTRTYLDTKLLRLIYIGGVNEHRGVIEASRYVRQFNETHCGRKLHLTVYSPYNEIVDTLVNQYDIEHFDWIDYSKLMAELEKYDVGICLWLPIKKFYRNLPLKNFDYMSAGLPILTSNFGSLLKYIKFSGGGVGIDPQSYREFEREIIRMFVGEYRRQLGENGLNWVRSEGNFESEGRRYVNVFAKSSDG